MVLGIEPCGISDGHDDCMTVSWIRYTLSLPLSVQGGPFVTCSGDIEGFPRKQ